MTSFLAVAQAQKDGHRYLIDELKEALYTDYVARVRSNDTQQ